VLALESPRFHPNSSGFLNDQLSVARFGSFVSKEKEKKLKTLSTAGKSPEKFGEAIGEGRPARDSTLDDSSADRR
jgi:hypothetical protein